MKANDPKPVFIVGSTNTGTKCLHYTLLQHPDLGGILGEPHWFGIQPNLDGRLNRLFALFPCFHTNYHDPSKPIRAWGGGTIEKISTFKVFDWIHSVDSPPAKKNQLIHGPRMIVKSPKLSLRLRWLKELWPDCTIVVMIRNPWAVIEGLVRKIKIMGDCPFLLDIPTATAQYNNVYTTIALDSIGLDNIFTVRYEDLIQASTFPGQSVSSNAFWANLLSNLQLPATTFTIPNAEPFSNFEQTRDYKSLEKLSSWDIDFISRACQRIIHDYGYDNFLKEHLHERL